ncbi:biotin/lipoyl-containing protein [Alkalihalobacillus sp. TS-13]|uniref:biotin/lipoyl-containing protein n=1 Tax=Alkalihalobacillus sp. TS-13 TaxID=2842455 RepID=UPI001C87D083|nr:biotin/lipoyl-containing protein [Alkalihalobacillus sp. TS-13]
MKHIFHNIYSPYSGTIEKILTKQTNHVYEWEKLFVINTMEGKKEISVGISGHIISLEVQEGETITPTTMLGRIKDDLLITGSD